MNKILHKTNYNPGISQNSLRGAIQDFKVNSIGNPALSYFGTRGMLNSRSSSYFRDHEYDLNEIGRIVDTEAFVSRAFTKKVTLIFKEGFLIDSKDSKNLEYVKRRLREIEFVSNRSFRKLIKEAALNLVMFHNFYVVKVRKKAASSGKMRQLGAGREREVPPVAAYFNIAPETVQVRVNDAGEPVRFRQNLLTGRYREFPDYNVIHGYYNRRTGFTMGTPSLEALKDDIMALRRIEESVETLIYKNLFPIIHVKVGTEKSPAKSLPDGTTEVSLATTMLRNIEDNGGVVTSERVEIDAVGSESQALRVEAYLQHFKKRVFAGLGMSGIDFGDGDATGRATGEVLSSSLKDSVTDYQRELEEIITREIFDELLMESGRYQFEYEIPEEERVIMTFNTIDVDEKIKKETHCINAINTGLLTSDEARKDLNKEPLTEEDMQNLHSIKLQRLSNDVNFEYDQKVHTLDLETARVSAAAKAKASGGSSGSKTRTASTKKTKSGNTKTTQSKKSGAANAAKNRVKPRNQNTDSLIAQLCRLIDRDHAPTLKHTRMIRAMYEYTSLNITDGLLNNYETKESNNLLNNLLADIIEYCDNNRVSSARKKQFIRKTIDKLDNYINNIKEGL